MISPRYERGDVNDTGERPQTAPAQAATAAAPAAAASGTPTAGTLNSYYGNESVYAPVAQTNVPYITSDSFNAAKVQAPGTAQAAQVNPADFQSYLNQYMGANEKALAPQFAQQQDQLNSDLNARGLNNSSAASYEVGNLYGQQASALAAANAPLINQGFGAATSGALQNAGFQQQANSENFQGQLQSALANAGYQQQAGQANANAANQANVYNANAYENVQGSNTAQYNNYLNNLFNQNSGLGGAAFQALMGTYGDPTAVNSLGSATGSISSGAGQAYGNASNQQFEAQQNSYNQFAGALGSVFGLGASFI